MDKLRHYIIYNLSILFFSIFLPLFAIASVIFLIKLATYTAIIELTLLEMGKLYLFVLPELLFYTLPIAFFVGSALTLFRLSNDNEMIVIFSLGISPTYIAKVLALPTLLLSLLLLFNFIVITPYVKVISANFIDQKKAEAQFNLSASEFGHNFGDWMLFINSTDEQTLNFKNVILFNKEIKDGMLISAQEARLMNINGILKLNLLKGKSYSYNDENLKTIHFDSAFINDVLSNEPEPYLNTLDYWTDEDNKDRKQQRFITNTLISFFPLLSIFLIIALGVVHARHQKRWIYLWLFLSIVGFYTAAIVLQKWLSFHTIWVVSIAWIIITYGFYKRLVGSRF